MWRRFKAFISFLEIFQTPPDFVWRKEDSDILRDAIIRSEIWKKVLIKLSVSADLQMKESVLSGGDEFCAGKAAGYLQAIQTILDLSQHKFSDVIAWRGNAQFVANNTVPNSSSADAKTQKGFVWKMSRRLQKQT